MSSATNTQHTIVNFYDNYVPTLKGGQYSITVNQTITKSDGNSIDSNKPATDPLATLTQYFLINGPRFSLPPDDVDHTFPANGVTGTFDQYLPQIVLNESKLPWERDLALTPGSGNNPSVNEYPWMALLVFGEDELLGPQPPPNQKPSANSQKNPTLIGSATLDAIASSGSILPANILGPAVTAMPNEDFTAITCNFVDIPVNIFNAVCPSLDDAYFLAHTREVSLANKATDVSGQDGFFSAVIANRFSVKPTNGKATNKNIAHLVSLEGFESYLQSGATTVTNYEFVRMISLYSWSFTVQEDPAQNFETLMQNLVANSAADRSNLLLSYPIPESSQSLDTAITAKLNNGYVPLGYEMLSGDQTFAWYRGPFTPIMVSRFLQDGIDENPNPQRPYSAGDAMIFDPTTGIFDQSYAVAFQTGRSLALASKPFAISLSRWRRNAYNAVNLLLEYMRSPVYQEKMLADNFISADGSLTQSGIADLVQLLNGDIVSNVLTDFFATDFFQNLASTIGQKAGFNNADTTVIVNEAPPPGTAPFPNGIADLVTLMQEPVIVGLLQHLAGFDNLGTLAQAFTTNATSLTLTSPLSENVSSGSRLVIYSPDNSQCAWVMIGADASIGDTNLTIAAYSGSITFQANSTLQLQDADQDAQAVVDWLAETALLHNVPFNNLIAHPAMLPQESIRFFYIDQNWTDALLDGALSIGIQSSRDSLFHKLMRNSLYQAVSIGMSEVKDRLMGFTSQANAPSPTQPAGFVVRSQAIASYPGLLITALDTAQNPMLPLRLDTLASDLIVAIYPDIPSQVTFTQPYEGLVFGVEDSGIQLRYTPGVTNYEPESTGTAIPGCVVSIEQIQNARRNGQVNAALNVSGTGENCLINIIQNALPGMPALTPSSFAVQMVKVPEQMVFNALN